MAQKTITVFLRGGMGNQMFQYALGLNLAKKNGAELVLDTVFLNDRFPRKEFTYRVFDLDIFSLEPRFTALSKISEKFPLPALWLGIDLAFMKIRGFFGLQTIVKEKNEHHFDPDVLRAHGNVLLWGYWQSEKYFKDVADDVRKAFSFKNNFSGLLSRISSDETSDGDAASLAEKIKSSNSVSLHVRRGDYVKFESVKKIAGDTNLSYYARAISYIAERVPAPNFFIFSDDIAWCRENISTVMGHDSASLGSLVRHEKNFPADSLPSVKVPFPVTYCDDTTAGPKASFHLQLMSLCKHNIIANSTFSWWGAWLNRNPDKIVIAPEKWNTSSKEDQADVVPAGWIRM